MADEAKPTAQGATESGSQTESQGGSILDGGEGTNQGTQQQTGGSADPKAGQGTAEDFADLKLPEGTEVDEAFIKDVKGWAKETGLKTEGLQKLIDRLAAQDKASTERAQKEYQSKVQKQKADWFNELKSDKEFGGANLQASALAAQKALKKFDPSGEIKKAIKASNLDNWPPLAKLLAAVGKAVGDDSVAGTVTGGTTPSAQNDDQKFHQELYPTMKK